MNKQAFLAELGKGLSGLPQGDIQERVSFYSEMIDDRMEEGLSEQEAVARIGQVDEIIRQIIEDTPLTKPVKEKSTPKKRRKGWEIILLVLGAPIGLSLAIAAFAVVLSLYASLWVGIIALWAVFGSLVGCAVGGVLSGGVFVFSGHGLTAIAMMGAGFLCAGLSVFLFYGCKGATKGIFLLTKKIVLSIKNRFIKKEEA